MKRLCSVCGKKPRRKTGAKCTDCYNEYMRAYMLKLYHKRRAQAIEVLGGVCIDCGSSDDLQLDHAVAAEKSFDIAKLWSASKARFEAELKKCVLRCAPHHIEKSLREGDIRTVEHGGGLTGKRGCYCELCGPLKRGRTATLRGR